MSNDSLTSLFAQNRTIRMNRTWLARTHMWKNEDVIQLFNKLLSKAFKIIELHENDEKKGGKLEIYVKSEHKII